MKVKVGYLNFNTESMDELISLYDSYAQSHAKTFTVTPNLDHYRVAHKDKAFRDAINSATIQTVDGKPILWIAKWLRIKGVQNKVSGSDLGARLLNLMNEKRYSLFLFGGQEGVAAKAKERILQDYPNIEIVGTLTPDFGYEKDEGKSLEYIKKINEKKPQFVYLCTGAPKTEKFFQKHAKDFGDSNYLSIGATIDFIAGNIKRAPAWMSNHGLEWLYRLSKDFKRLFKRYWLDGWFLVKMWFLCHFRRKMFEETK